MIQRIADIPFPEKHPLDLLHLTTLSADGGPDLDYAGFGYASAPLLNLLSLDTNHASFRVRDVLLVGLHAVDDLPDDVDDIELLFEFPPEDDEDEELVITAPLAKFLEIHLPPLLATSPAREVVLAVCNPHQWPIHKPECLKDRPLYVPYGDVTSHMMIEADEKGLPTMVALDSVRLEAVAWQKLH